MIKAILQKDKNRKSTYYICIQTINSSNYYDVINENKINLDKYIDMELEFDLVAEGVSEIKAIPDLTFIRNIELDNLGI